MVTKSEVIRVELTTQQIDRCKYHAEKAAIGGQSNIRTDDREKMLNVDQLVGQFTTAAAYLYLGIGFNAYNKFRYLQNQNPLVGDGGKDILTGQIDVKGSRLRKEGIPLEKYHLLVRPKELHTEWTYLFAIAQFDDDLQKVVVFLVGWATTVDLPKEPEADGKFQGAHVLNTTELKRLPPFQFPNEGCQVE